MMENDKLYNQALEAIRTLFEDTSVSSEEAKRNLNSLIDEIYIMLETLPE